jgi:flagellar biosynthetic protein FlhB
MAAGGDRTEKATPKKRAEARKKGQVAKSVDLNGAAVLMAGVLALSAFAPGMVQRLGEAMRSTLELVANPEVVGEQGLGAVLMGLARTTAGAVAPVLLTCCAAGVVANVAQVGFRPSPQALKPNLKKLDPLAGAKNLFGSRAAVEAGKGITKVGVVGAVTAAALLPQVQDLAALVGTPPAVLLPLLAKTALSIVQRAAAAYLVIALADYGYQRWKHEKDLRMDKQEVKDEFKQQELPSEIRSAQRRRAMHLANARMMDAVPTADVIVTNPTHYSVALRYDPSSPAPVVVAKGVDQLAFKIREIAGAAGVAIVPDPPLARSLYAIVEIGQSIPEELYQGVAQLLAYVYRLNARKVAA